MPTPANRAKIQLVRGSYANILASIGDLLDGELCYAKDENKLYMVEGATLTPLDYLGNTDVSETVQDLIGAAISGGTGLTSSYDDGTGVVTIDLDDTAVTPGSYGSGTAIPSLTVDQQGRITAISTTSVETSAGNLTVIADSGANETINLDTETLTISGDTGITTTTTTNGVSIDLDDTAVTPGTYGSPTAIPSIVIDQQGRITSASTNNINSSSIGDFDTAVRETTGIDQTFEPMGHAVRLDSTISFDPGTRQFSIAPTASSYDVWCKGVKYTKTGTDTVTINNTTGLYYIYFDASGALQFRTSYFDWDDDVPTSYIYWNANDGAATYFADERHGIALDWATHEYLHRTRGAVIANGFSISNYTLTGDGSIDSHCYIDLSGGTFFDEDLEVVITHSPSPSANSWEQDLSGPALIPVFYLYNQAWTKDSATNFPFKQGSSYPQYNLYTAGTNSWSTVDATANKYIVQFVIATHNLGAPIISVMGQGQYDNVGDAEEVGFEDLALDGFPSVEFRPLYKLVYQVGSYANSVNARLRSVIDIRQVGSAGVGQGLGSDHGILTGLGDDDHLQYLHVTETRTGITADITTSGTLKTTDTTASTDSTTGALVISGGVGIGGDVNIAGNLTVSGTTTSLETETLVVEDKNIELGVVTTPTDTTANSGGITLKGSTDKTITWLNSTDAWTFSEHIDIASGKEYYINGASVLSSTTLGSSVVNSSLTSVGTIATGTWDATEIAVTKGGTGLTSVAKGTVLVANASNTITALDGGGVNDGYLFYDAATDTISWVTEIDGGTY